MYPLHRGRPAPSPRPSLIPMPPHQPAPPHQKHNSTISTIARNISAEDPASVEEKVPSRCPDLPRKPDLPRSFRSPAYHRTLAYHDAHRHHRGPRPERRSGHRARCRGRRRRAGYLRQARTSPAAAAGGPSRAVRYRPSTEFLVATATTAVTRQAAIWARIVASVTALPETKLAGAGYPRPGPPEACAAGRSWPDLSHMAFRYRLAGGVPLPSV